jgi:hypothetical protein
MKKPHTTRMPAARCPHCSHLIDAATHHDGAKHAPAVGDWGVCTDCGGLLQFNTELRMVAGLAGELAREPVETRALIARMQQRVRERNRQD